MKTFVLLSVFLAGCIVGDPGSGSGSAGGEGGGNGGGGGGGTADMLIDGGMGSGSGSGAACTGADYDPCTDNTQCTSGNCRLFNGDGIQVCTTTCTPGDSTTCPLQAGQPATCNNMGMCKPATANTCTR